MKNNVWLTFLIILGTYFNISGQYCDNALFEEYNIIAHPLASPEISSACAQSINYAPYPYSEHTPIKKVRICFHIFQKSDGSGNFQNTTEDKNYLLNLVDSLNIKFSNFSQPYPGTSPHVQESKIEFEVSDFYFYQSDGMWNFQRNDPNTPEWDDRELADSIYDNVIIANPNLDNTTKYHTEHLLLGEGIEPFYRGGFAYVGIARYVYLRGYYRDRGNISTLRSHLSHEIGHVLGLQHNFNDTTTDGLGNDCTPNCSDIGCPIMGTSNNLMDYLNRNNKNALSECQLGRIHYYLMGKVGTISNCLIEDYCYYNDDYNININSGENIFWEGSKYLRSNITVKNNGRLTIYCETSMPIGSKITVENGGELVIEDGWFYNACDNSGLWGTIEVQNGGYLEINSTLIRDYGIVIKSGGTLRIRDELLVYENGYINIESNAYLCIDEEADIELTNEINSISLFAGYNSGVNTTYVPNPGTCTSDLLSMTISGSGCICSCSSDQQIQNETISSNRYICGDDIDIGYDVTGETNGPVSVENDSKLIINASGDVLLKNQITIEEGSELIIR